MFNYRVSWNILIILRWILQVGWIYMADMHDDVIKWKHFPRYWPFLRGIHRSPVNSTHKGQWRGALMFTLICARINGWVNNREAGDLRHNRAHYDVIIMSTIFVTLSILRQIYHDGMTLIWCQLNPILTSVKIDKSICKMMLKEKKIKPQSYVVF